MKKLLPLLFLLFGGAIGAGAGIFLAPAPIDAAACAPDAHNCAAAAEPAPPSPDASAPVPEYVRLKNQFVVPVVHGDAVRLLVVLSISLETDAATVETIYSREPKLRDAFLRVLFDHAHMGGFDGPFTEAGRLELLRVALLESAQSVIGPEVTDILITDLVRQET